MRMDNISILYDTLDVLNSGYYVVNGKRVDLKLSKEEMLKAEVFLPKDVEKVSASKEIPHVHVMGRMGCSCENMDSFSLAKKRNEECALFLKKPIHGKEKKKILVLNLANPVNPGGGVRRGAKAQEEDLCRRSSLLLSLEGEASRAYYEYNRSLNTFMGSDAVIIHPNVEVFKDENGEFLEETFLVSVMTCAAPMLTYGMEGMSQKQYEVMVYNRITGMLKVAAYMGYEMLVLGAFGCGAFKNDARVVSDLFYKALKEFDYDGMKAKDFFRRVDFAVLSRTPSQYNYKEFSRNFNDFYREEDFEETKHAFKKMKETEKSLDMIKGSLFGGAVGDALGYTVEFWSEEQIFDMFGCKGITSYRFDRRSGKALISDDTQMTLFTANGLLVGNTRGAMRGIAGDPRVYVEKAYQDWLKTQQSSMEEVNRYERYSPEGGNSWLLDVPELYALRAPGNTCLSALREGSKGILDYIKHPVNHSKGCGGIMRVAPLALKYRLKENYYGTIQELDREGAQLAAITHGHSLGYMPAAVLTHVLARIVSESGKVDLKEVIIEARDTAKEIFAGDIHLEELVRIIDLAIELSENGESDLANIHLLGEGWVAEETLGISLYCALKYQNDFSAGIIASVNHKGDSDSTGAVTGNILGALLGYEAIEDKWKENLELSDVILEMAEDLCHGCQMSEYSSYQDPAWISKYMKMHRVEK